MLGAYEVICGMNARCATGASRGRDQPPRFGAKTLSQHTGTYALDLPVLSAW